MINLNLYPDSKVCLSLLGTWFARDTIGNWRPGISTILQRLLSIRAMISVSDSQSQNAPIDLGTFPRDAALFYRSVQAQTIWFFMLNWLVDTGKRNGVWKAIVQRYFTMRQEDILRRTNEWIRKSPGLRRWAGHFTGGGVPKLGPLQEYVPGFYGHRTIDRLVQLENNLPASIRT
jgi:hypothetical protein